MTDVFDSFHATTAEVGDSIRCRSVFVRAGPVPGLKKYSRAAVIPGFRHGCDGRKICAATLCVTCIKPSKLCEGPSRGLASVQRLQALGKGTAHIVGIHSERPVLDSDSDLRLWAPSDWPPGNQQEELANGATRGRGITPHLAAFDLLDPVDRLGHSRKNAKEEREDSGGGGGRQERGGVWQRRVACVVCSFLDFSPFDGGCPAWRRAGGRWRRQVGEQGRGALHALHGVCACSRFFCRPVDGGAVRPYFSVCFVTLCCRNPAARRGEKGEQPG